MEHLVSVITPSFNCGNYIGATIESVMNQTYTEWELIIIDDGSTDNSADIIRYYAKLDSRIIPIFLPTNRGAAVARNEGLFVARGRFIAFLDSDDIWLPQKLEVQLEFMNNTGAPISFTEYEVYDEEMVHRKNHIKVPSEINYTGYLKSTIIGMSTSVIDTEKTGDISFHNLRTRQDTYLWISLLKSGIIAKGIHQTLMKYRIRKKFNFCQ